jgi:hypothetical protein
MKTSWAIILILNYLWLTSKLTGGDGAQRNPRPVQRLFRPSSTGSADLANLLQVALRVRDENPPGTLRSPQRRSPIQCQPQPKVRSSLAE